VVFTGPPAIDALGENFKGALGAGLDGNAFADGFHVLLFLYLSFECCKGVVPELVEIVAQGIEALGVDLVQAAGALAVVHYKVGFFKDAEVLRDGGPGDREVASQFADRLRAVEQARKYCATSGVAECVELRSLVRIHLR
jgi:hypothetical protein